MSAIPRNNRHSFLWLLGSHPRRDIAWHRHLIGSWQRHLIARSALQSAGTDCWRVAASGRYRPEIMQGLREGLRKACSSFRCCVAIDAWDAAYVRAVDSSDGRHYELRTPTLKLTVNLLLNALAAECPLAGTA